MTGRPAIYSKAMTPSERVQRTRRKAINTGGLRTEVTMTEDQARLLRLLAREMQASIPELVRKLTDL